MQPGLSVKYMYIYIKQTYIPVEVFCGNYLNETKLTYGFLFTTKTYLFILRIYIHSELRKCVDCLTREVIK